MNRLTAYEKCQIIGKRASDIQNGAKILTDHKGLLNPLLIAEKEYKEGKIPIKIIRTLPDGRRLEIKIKPKN